MLDLPFLDWNDYQPFYEYKFLRAFRQLDRHEDLDSFRRLFEVFVPHFKVRHVDEILALRQDKRLEAVKALARATRPDEVSSEMVRQALSDALKMKDKALGFNRVVSLITIPIGFIPIWGDPLQILVQDIVERVYRSHLETKYEWQCFFVDLHTDYRYEVLQDRLDSAHPM
jgi:hypothetical protein